MYTACEEGAGEHIPVTLQLLVTFYKTTPWQSDSVCQGQFWRHTMVPFFDHVICYQVFSYAVREKMKTLATDQK